jgi:multidrug efflux pump subunit AcrA (membrane-fusion protein)
MSIDFHQRTQSSRRATANVPVPPSHGAPRRSSGAWVRRGLSVAGLLSLLAVAGFILKRTVAPGGGTELLTHTIARSDLAVNVVEQGTLESSNNREIKCKVKGGSTVLSVVESGAIVQPGDVLVRLDTSTIEDNINLQKIACETALANKTTAESEVGIARIGVTEYLDGTFRSEQATKQKDLVIAESNLKSAMNMRDFARRMFRKGFTSDLDLESKEDAVKHAELEVQVKQTDLEVLEKYTRAKMVEELQNKLKAAEGRLAACTAAVNLEQARLDRVEQQLKNCVICAEVGGMVIHPTLAEWRDEPEIEEGATVREDQVLLIMPDLKQMQVKVGIHESKVERVKPGMPARIRFLDRSIDGEVLSIATVTKPTGWWTGNLVKYDTIVKLPPQEGLKPGMSVAVEIFLARHRDVLTIPVAAVLEDEGEFWCWVATDGRPARHKLTLGDTNDQFVVVEAGVEEGDQVVLNPLDFIDEAQRAALNAPADAESQQADEQRPKGDDSSSSGAGITSVPATGVGRRTNA